jgi:ribosome maturation protein SDO1
MAEKLNVARIKKFGKNFEISIDPDKAVAYRAGQVELNEVLQADYIFLDAKKGEVAPEIDLEKAFKTTNLEKIAEIILKQGEIQITSEQRSEEREQRRRKLVGMINVQAVDPTSGLPHPAKRIEAALDQAKVNIDNNKPIEDQFLDIVSKLRPIIPLKIEQRKLIIIVPGAHAGKAYHVVHKAKVLQEEWQSDGSWKVSVELPAGLVQEFIDKLNSLTQGEVIIE